MGAQPPRIAPPQPFRVGTRIGLVYKAAQARARLALDMFATPLHEKPEKAYQLDPEEKGPGSRKRRAVGARSILT